MKAKSLQETECTIGLLSRRTGVKIPTIRYYEQIGLLPEPRRSPRNQRLYGNDHFTRLSFIRHCRYLGFSQSAIRDLLELSSNPEQSCDAIDSIACIQRDQIEQRIKQLDVLKSELDDMICACKGGNIKNCRIVEALIASVGAEEFET